jgi:NAD-dependent deacetylase
MDIDDAVKPGESRIASAASLIRGSAYLTAFTGAGISVESGVPPFRGEGGLWSSYDPRLLEIGFFKSDPEASWKCIREIFYRNFAGAVPNTAHLFLADLERRGVLKFLVTQNIDDLHYQAGSRNVAEFHGNSRLLACLKCGARSEARSVSLETLPPRCPCGGIYKPDFVFFGEGIPPAAYEAAVAAARKTDVMLVIGSTGEVFPAAEIPGIAKRSGAAIIEINPEPSGFTFSVTDVFIRGKAAATAARLGELLGTVY